MMNFLKRFGIFLLFVPGVPLIIYFCSADPEHISVGNALVSTSIAAVCGYLCTGCFPWLNKGDNDDGDIEDEDEEPLFSGIIVKRTPEGKVTDNWRIANATIEYIFGGSQIKVSFPTDANKPEIVIEASNTFMVMFRNGGPDSVYDPRSEEFHCDGEHTRPIREFFKR